MVEKAGKFISPFTASDSVQQLDNADTQGIQFTMPDDDDFNPDTMLPELNELTQDLDDSLCFDEGEETQLPFDELDVGVPSISELHEDNSTTHTEPNKGSGEDLNDSLCGDDIHEETQYHADTANDIQPAAQNIPTPNLDDSMEMVDNDDTLQATTSSPEGSKLPQSQTKVLNTNTGASNDDDPNLDELFPETIHDPQDCSGEGSKTEETEGDSSKTEGGSNKSEGCSDKCEKSSSPIQQSTKVVPSFGKKKKGFMPPTVKAPDPASSSSSATATKSAPKTKESSFTSETKEQNCEGAKLDESSVSNTQKNQKKESCSGANKENSPSQDETQEPNFSAPKLADTTTDNKVATAEVPANTTTAKKTKATVKKPPQGKKDNDAKKQEKENKKLEKEQKKLEQEQRKAEKERLKEEKRLEQERKKVEREQKKIEKDLKKLEREQKKAQKQQKPQKKKISGKDSGAQSSSNSEGQHNSSCEQGTAEKISETSLMAANDKTGDKGSAVSNCSGTRAPESADDSNQLLDTDSTSPSEATSTASTETTPPPKCNPNAPEGMATEASTSENVLDNCDREMPETMKPRERKLSSPGETSAEDPGDSVVTKELDVSATTDSFNQTNCNGVSSEQPSEKSNMLQDTNGSAKDDTNAPKEMVTTKDPEKQQASSKVKKNQPNKSARQQDSTSSQTQNKKKAKSAKTQNDKKVSSSAGSRKRKAMTAGSTSESEIEPPEPKKPRSKPSNYYGPVWVQCEKPDCQKWRQLKDCLDPSEIPERWTCSMNTEAAYSSCLAPEEQWSEPEDSQEFVESPYVPGSIVWAKMDGYPWWPAMMEEDPDREAYYEMGEHRNVPVRYHVVFFDTPVCRAWVFAVSVQPFSEDSNANEAGNVTVAQKYRRALREGIKQAKKALKMTVAARLSQLTFAKRFSQTAGSRKRNYLMAEETVGDNTHHRSGAKPKSGSRKSSRLDTSKLIEDDCCDVKQQVASTNGSTHSNVSVETVASTSMKGREEDESLKVDKSANVLREVEDHESLKLDSNDNSTNVLREVEE